MALNRAGAEQGRAAAERARQSPIYLKIAGISEEDVVAKSESPVISGGSKGELRRLRGGTSHRRARPRDETRKYIEACRREPASYQAFRRAALYVSWYAPAIGIITAEAAGVAKCRNRAAALLRHRLAMYDIEKRACPARRS